MSLENACVRKRTPSIKPGRSTALLTVMARLAKN